MKTSSTVRPWCRDTGDARTTGVTNIREWGKSANGIIYASTSRAVVVYVRVLCMCALFGSRQLAHELCDGGHRGCKTTTSAVQLTAFWMWSFRGSLSVPDTVDREWVRHVLHQIQ